MLVTPSAMLILVSELHPLNALSPMLDKSQFIITFSKLSQFSNAWLPICKGRLFVSIVTIVSSLQSAKASAFIFQTLPGIMISAKSQYRKARSAIPIVPCRIDTPVTDVSQSIIHLST